MKVALLLLAVLGWSRAHSHLIGDEEDYSQVGQLRQLTSDRYDEEADNSGDPYEMPISAGSGCPSECQCNRVAQIADCSNRNLLKVPSSFPRDIKRIRLERNNITELPAYAFKGLKRLQRIDLSNNKLVKIDPLAFAGNLQALNSLMLYSNRLSQLPSGLFSGLSQLQLLLLNANNLKCVSKQLFGSLTNLNLLSLYDNQIETIANGTFDGLQNIKTIHLGKNPLNCDCNLRWLADYLDANPVETSEARCERPSRNQAKKLNQLSKQKFRCEAANEESRSNKAVAQCDPELANQPEPAADSSCPTGCQCDGITVDCSRASQSESRAGALPAQGTLYELPDVPEDVPIYVTRLKFNDNRIKRIRQTGLFRRLANSRKLDLGSSKIVDVEDNYISASASGSGSTTGTDSASRNKPERVVFVLLENDSCDAHAPKTPTLDQVPTLLQAAQQSPQMEGLVPVFKSACELAPKVIADSACYNGGSCVNSAQVSSNFSCLCPPGFAGPLCEVNLDDCQDHQCQNGAACVDGVNSYRCVCRDPTTSGEFCEQLNLAPTNSISGAPLALPIVAGSTHMQTSEIAANNNNNINNISQMRRDSSSQILARSADSLNAPTLDLVTASTSSPQAGGCRRVTQKRHYEDGNGCRSIRQLKVSTCEQAVGLGSDTCPTGCCSPIRTKQRRVRMQCHDGASYVKTVELIRKCGCLATASSQCPISAAAQQRDSLLPRYQYNSQLESTLPGRARLSDLSASSNVTQEDQVLQITRLDGVD